MKFNELDQQMRVYETAHDHCVIPGVYMVARIDGRGFTKLTKETYKFEAPFDEKFRDMMVETTKHLMECGFKILFGYTESDEISLLIDKNDTSFQRKERKLNSILAGEASAKFSVLIGSVGAFDCRISQLPFEKLVIDYFRWRNEDAHRNALSAHCYWALRKEGKSPTEADKGNHGLSTADKNELLFQRGINFNEIPNWQKRGVGIYWENYEKEGVNQRTGEKIVALRKRLKIDYDLPMKDNYSSFIENILKENR